MKNGHFDLESAIVSWRAFQIQQRTILSEDLDELESHLREHVWRLAGDGVTEKAAFEAALQSLGDFEAAEYDKVYWGKLKRTHTLTAELTWRIAMLKNYLKIAFRGLRKHRGFSLINITGLAIGLACSFFILIWVRSEVGTNRFHEDGHAIFQIRKHALFNDRIQTLDSMPKPLEAALRAEYPEISKAVNTVWPRQFIVTSENQSFRETGNYAGPEFFDIFTFPFLRGNPETALHEVNALVITDRTARKLFGENWQAKGDVLNQTLTIDHRSEFSIAGVIEDIPTNSTIQFDVLLPIQDFYQRNPWVEHWGNNNFPLYVKLKDGTDAAVLNEKIAGAIDAHRDRPTGQTLFLQAFEDIYLHSTYRDGILVGGRIEYVQIFTAIGLFLLLIAGINYMNLATARSTQRAREIGVRKAVGAHRQSLFRQFMSESIVITGISFGLAALLIVILLPSFNELTGKQISLSDFSGYLILAMIGVALLLSLFSGSYPAFYLSSFDPIAILRGTFRKAGKASLRQSLVVFQFALSVILIVATIAVYMQIHFIRTQNLGMERDNLLYIPLEGAISDQQNVFKQELLRQPGIASATVSSVNPLAIGSSTSDPTWEGKSEDDNSLFYIINADYDFIETMKMEMTAGRAFSKDFGADSVNYIVNEEAVKAIGKNDILGESIDFWNQSGQVVGVVKNFNMNSFYEPIENTIIRIDPDEAGMLFVRTKPGEIQQAIESMESLHNRFNPGYPFQYTFLDQDFEATYRSETIMGTLASIFAGIALFISCLGLFGLSTFSIEQRVKEIGVRKVLGASVLNLATMLTSNFSKLVLIGALLAIPVAYVVVNQWLDNFADSIDLGVGVFLVAGAIVLGITLLTVGYQSVKAALADPVKSLRYE